jgi:transcriptional regulator with XRE-family HTH domain
MRSEFSALMERKYLEWQLAQGERRSIEAFADYLNIKKTTLVQWMNDQRKPGPENVERLAEALGIEVYDALNLPRPDERLLQIKKVWEDLSEEEQAAFAAEIERTAANNRQKAPEKQKRERIPKKTPVTRPAKSSAEILGRS